jgi:hypothetical protein
MPLLAMLLRTSKSTMVRVQTRSEANSDQWHHCSNKEDHACHEEASTQTTMEEQLNFARSLGIREKQDS